KYKKSTKDYIAIQVNREVMDDTITSVSLFLNIRKNASHPFLLESVAGGEQLARYSFLGKDPYQILQYKNGNINLQRGGKPVTLQTDYFSALKELTEVRNEPAISG